MYLFQELVRLSAEKGYRPFFFGARQWVVEKVVDEFQKKYPNLNVAGYRNGYYKENEEREVVEMIRDSHADVETPCDDESGVCLDGDEGVF